MAIDYDFIWKTVATFIFGVFALRVAGRKSLAQMTVAETVVMIAIGTILIEPLVGKELYRAYAAVTLIVGALVALEHLQMRWSFLERLFTGKSITVIQNGTIQYENLRKIRMTINQLEMHLRQASIGSFSEVKYATIEPNGQLGFALEERAQPVTKGDIANLIARIDRIEQYLLKGKDAEIQQPSVAIQKEEIELFREVNRLSS